MKKEIMINKPIPTLLYLRRVVETIKEYPGLSHAVTLH